MTVHYSDNLYRDYPIVAKVKLDDTDGMTVRTKHWRDGSLLRKPSFLFISRWGVAEFYLLYFNKDGNEQTDTYHESLLAALEQAKFEFDLELDRWDKVIASEFEGITEIIVDRD